MPFAAALPAAIGAAGSIGSSLLNRSGGSGTSAIGPAVNQLQSNAATTANQGGNLLNLGNANTNAGANFFKTILGGSAADTSALLQPDINRINAGNQQTLQATANLTPRGGGRSSTLFQLPFAGQQQIQSLFNNARSTAASALPQIGAGQTSAGTNLFNASTGAAGDQGRIALEQQQINNLLRQGQGAGLFGLLSMPGGPFSKIPGLGGFGIPGAAPGGTPPFLPS